MGGTTVHGESTNTDTELLHSAVAVEIITGFFILLYSHPQYNSVVISHLIILYTCVELLSKRDEDLNG